MPTKEKENIFVEFADELKGTDQISQEQIEKVHGGDRFRGEDQGCPQCSRVYRVGDLESTKGKCLDCGTRVFPESNYESDSSGCVLAGTLITMSCGCQKPVEEIKPGDDIMAWDFNEGKYVKAKVVHNFHADLAAKEAKIITLTFEDDIKLSLVNVHSLFDISEAKYVELDENASEFISDEFAIKDGESFKAVKLINVEVKVEVVKAYSPITFKHINCITNGFISVPAYFPIICNNYDVDTKTLSYINKEEDNTKYGLLKYEEVKHLGSTSLFNAFNAETVKIALAKNGKSIKDIENIFAAFAEELKGTDQISQEQLEKVQGGAVPLSDYKACPSCSSSYKKEDLESTKGKCTNCGARVFAESNYESDSGCVLAGTLITMAEHTTKKVEDVKDGESVLCWDFEIGQFVEEKVIHNFHADDKATMSNIIELEFEEENKLSIVNVHSLFDISKAKYVEINENASEFIGDEFAIQDGYKFKAVKLLKAEVYRDVVNSYSPITYRNINCLTNGFISIPGYFPIICNNYDVDVDELKFVNQKADNEKYGLATYEELKELGSPRLYDVLNAEIVKIALAKNGKSIKDIAKILKSFKSEIDRI